MIHVTNTKIYGVTLAKQVFVFFPASRWCPSPWWRHQMETLSALLALCAGNSPVTCDEFPSQTPVTRSFDVLSDLRVNERLSDLRCYHAHCDVIGMQNDKAFIVKLLTSEWVAPQKRLAQHAALRFKLDAFCSYWVRRCSFCWGTGSLYALWTITMMWLVFHGYLSPNTTNTFKTGCISNVW